MIRVDASTSKITSPDPFRLRPAHELTVDRKLSGTTASGGWCVFHALTRVGNKGDEWSLERWKVVGDAMSVQDWEVFVSEVANDLVERDTRVQRASEVVAASVRDHAPIAICCDGTIRMVRQLLPACKPCTRSLTAAGTSDCLIDGVPVPMADIVTSGRQCVVPMAWCSPTLDDVVIVQLPPLEPPFQRNTYGWFVRACSSRLHGQRVWELTILPLADVERLVQRSMADGDVEIEDFVDRRIFRLPLKARRAVIREHQDVVSRLAPYNSTRLKRMLSAYASDKKRKRGNADTESADDAPTVKSEETVATTEEMCVVCLEMRKDAKPRCHDLRCRSATCYDCHAKTRGLCVICDRDLLHSHYVCVACHDVCELKTFGYGCVSCDDRRLCRSCWQSYADCWDCKASAAKGV